MQELNQERFRARASATTREADLAHDARELLRLDVGIEQVAERLGVTRNHLQQALLRNPETTERAAA
jgi:DNA-binding phage protein